MKRFEICKEENKPNISYKENIKYYCEETKEYLIKTDYDQSLICVSGDDIEKERVMICEKCIKDIDVAHIHPLLEELPEDMVNRINNFSFERQNNEVLYKTNDHYFYIFKRDDDNGYDYTFTTSELEVITTGVYDNDEDSISITEAINVILTDELELSSDEFDILRFRNVERLEDYSMMDRAWISKDDKGTKECAERYTHFKYSDETLELLEAAKKHDLSPSQIYYSLTTYPIKPGVDNDRIRKDMSKEALEIISSDDSAVIYISTQRNGTAFKQCISEMVANNIKCLIPDNRLFIYSSDYTSESILSVLETIKDDMYNKNISKIGQIIFDRVPRTDKMLYDLKLFALNNNIKIWAGVQVAADETIHNEADETIHNEKDIRLQDAPALHLAQDNLVNSPYSRLLGVSNVGESTSIINKQTPLIDNGFRPVDNLTNTINMSILKDRLNGKYGK